MKNKLNYVVSNIVASTEISDELDLQKICSSRDNCEYEPEIYFALIYKIPKPKISILVNKSGKIIFTGAKSMGDIESARDIFFNDLKKLGYNPLKNVIKIQNLIVLVKLDERISIYDTIIKYNTNIEYCPEKFPAGILRNKDPKFTALIFNSGKISITGLKDFDSIDKCVSIIKKVLRID